MVATHRELALLNANSALPGLIARVQLRRSASPAQLAVCLGGALEYVSPVWLENTLPQEQVYVLIVKEEPFLPTMDRPPVRSVRQGTMLSQVQLVAKFACLVHIKMLPE